jgi:hypothetical protein
MSQQLAQMPKIARFLKVTTSRAGFANPGTADRSRARQCDFRATGKRLRSLPIVKSGINID